MEGIEYNDAWGQYVITDDYATNNLVWPVTPEQFFGTNEGFQKRLLEVSDDIYQFIMDNTKSKMIKSKMEYIHANDDCIKALRRAMLYQVRYYITSAGGAIKDQHGVDIHKSRAMNLGDLRGERRISPSAITELKRNPYILYRGDL